jgi:Xaa-Pro aminopeptidase
LIAAAGYGDAFGHSLGHGVGMEVHEIPAIKSGGRTKLRKNTVITVEPGIYIPGKGGVRIEDVVLVTDGGSEILTKSSKDIHIV